MITVYLVSFNRIVYQGFSISDAKMAAVRTGFECALVNDEKYMETWSPIGGWRTIYHVDRAAA